MTINTWEAFNATLLADAVYVDFAAAAEGSSDSALAAFLAALQNSEGFEDSPNLAGRIQQKFDLLYQSDSDLS